MNRQLQQVIAHMSRPLSPSPEEPLLRLYVMTFTTSVPGTNLPVFTGYSEKRRNIGTGWLTRSSPLLTRSPPWLNKFSLTLQSWGHVTCLGTVLLDQWTKMGLLALFCQRSRQCITATVNRLSKRPIKISCPSFVDKQTLQRENFTRKDLYITYVANFL